MGSLDHPSATPGRILFIDAFDSFTNNIVGLLERCLGVEVMVVHIDNTHVGDNFTNFVDEFDAVVVGPGPGHPSNPSDVGFINKLWKLDENHLLPVLGICLGFQSLCSSEGAQIKRLTRARHGIVNAVTHDDTDVFKGVGQLDATQYHSLQAIIDPFSHEVSWKPSETCPKLRPIAWDTCDDINGPILMGVRHETKPFWGVQFHPESICTSKEGEKLLENWWMRVQEWNQSHVRRNSTRRLSKTQSQLPSAVQHSRDGDVASQESPQEEHSTYQLTSELRQFLGGKESWLRWESHAASGMDAPQMVEAFGLGRDEVIMLDSQGHISGRYSILGLLVPGKTMKVTYRVSDKTLRFGVDNGRLSAMQLNSIDDVWPILQDLLDLHDPQTNPLSRASTPGKGLTSNGGGRSGEGHLPAQSPFWGGFMGYISYEAGLETIDVDLDASCKDTGVPDINFAFIHRSIVVDHQESQVYVQSLLPGDQAWIQEAGRIIDNLASRDELISPTESESVNKKQRTGLSTSKKSNVSTEVSALDEALARASVKRPEETEYRDKVLKCQDFLASGDSYELCLTDETQITVPYSKGLPRLDDWALYKRLRQNNPAPFGAFLRISDMTIVGSSPERFLRWTRDGHCQFRPIKGTVKKGPDMTREMAHEILGSSKERAENLMIVDLIRHDLSGVVGAHNTSVSKLMVVEEYETVYQLVSVIEGQLPDPAAGQPRGLHVLKASLPPGSMTGAPKKRSCEILRDIEQRPRGVYSGLLGYLDVGGAGDFSVVIRTAVRGDLSDPASSNGDKTTQSDVWRIGAGGAVTIQSTDDGEFHEMETKQSSVLKSLFNNK